VVGLLQTQVPALDRGKVWLDWAVLNQLNQTEGFATKLWVKVGQKPAPAQGWDFQTPRELLSDTIELIETKQAGQAFFYGLLLFLGLIAIFDTQALAVFRRKKEIGTLMAMGMSNGKVLALFVTEGAMHGVLATLFTALWGVPLFYWSTQTGLNFGVSGDQWGMVLGDVIYPVYKVGKVVSAVLMVNLLVLFVSFWPTRSLTHLTPAQALRGRAI